MSWMDSWSRPGKHQPTPVPFYLLPNGGEDIPYCRSCGRVINSRRAPPSMCTHNPLDTSLNSHRKHQRKGKRKGGVMSDDDRPADSSQTEQPQPSEVKYCSSRCRTNKPRKILDQQIEDAFVKFLSGDKEGHQIARETTTSGPAVKNTKKGDMRILVPCDVIEEYIFGEERRIRTGEDDREIKTFGRKKNRASRVIQPQPDDSGGTHNQKGYTDNRLDEVDNKFFDQQSRGSSSLDPHPDPEVQARLSIRSGTRIRPPQQISQVNGSVGGEKGWAERIIETDDMREKRIEGQRRSHEREMVRSAARRGVVFGFLIHQLDEQDSDRDSTKEAAVTQVRKKCEAVMLGKVVEPSFAKGSWGVRWREE